MVEDHKDNYITGWIKIYRSLSNKGWYKKSDYVHLWINILIKATHRGIEFMFNGENVKLSAGQFITGRKKLSEETGISESKIERILKFFEENEQQIEQQKTNRNRLITVLNWDLYQVTEQQSEQPVDTNKNVKNKKNIKEFWDLYHSITKLPKSDKEAAKKYWAALSEKEKQKAIDNIQPYYDSISDKKFIKKARTYLSSKSFNDEFKKKLVIKKTKFPEVND